MQTRELIDETTVRALSRDLHAGEAEAIALSLQLGFTTVLMDEHEGRAAAKAMGLTPVGILGVLLRAKLSGSLESVEQAMRALQTDAGFYIADSLPDIF